MKSQAQLSYATGATKFLYPSIKIVIATVKLMHRCYYYSIIKFGNKYLDTSTVIDPINPSPRMKQSQKHDYEERSLQAPVHFIKANYALV